MLAIAMIALHRRTPSSAFPEQPNKKLKVLGFPVQANVKVKVLGLSCAAKCESESAWLQRFL